MNRPINPITPNQIKALHATLKQLGLMEEKAELVRSASAGRTFSSKELSYQEARELLKGLKTGQAQSDPRMDRMRKHIIAMARELGWEVSMPDGRKADMKRINAWCKQYGRYRKSLMAHNYGELIELVTQFKEVYEYYIKQLSDAAE